MKVTDQRDVDAGAGQTVADGRDRRRGFGAIYRNAHQLGAGFGQRFDLRDRGCDVGGVGVGHRLHDHRRVATDADGANLRAESGAAWKAHRPIVVATAV